MQSCRHTVWYFSDETVHFYLKFCVLVYYEFTFCILRSFLNTRFLNYSRRKYEKFIFSVYS